MTQTIWSQKAMLKAPRPPGSLTKAAALHEGGGSHGKLGYEAGGVSKAISKERAEALALQGLTFLAGDADRLTQFLTSTGIDPGDLQNWDANPGIRGAVLDHLLSDESLLMVFATEANVEPQDVLPAQAVLSGAVSD
jgi:Protein of unknown function (DUF3572)